MHFPQFYSFEHTWRFLPCCLRCHSISLNTATVTIDPRTLATHCEFHLCVNKFCWVEPAPTQQPVLALLTLGCPRGPGDRTGPYVTQPHFNYSNVLSGKKLDSLDYYTRLNLHMCWFLFEWISIHGWTLRQCRRPSPHFEVGLSVLYCLLETFPSWNWG